MPCPECRRPLGNNGLMVNLEDLLHRPKKLCRDCFLKWLEEDGITKKPDRRREQRTPRTSG